MRSIARLKDSDLEEIFISTAEKKSIHPAVIEKDFWVCFMLDYLFHDCAWNRMLSFKGGTSLAKAYALIDRFSEDIDVILDWRLLGYGINEPWKDRSNTQQDKFNAEAEDRAATFLRDEFVPKVEDDLCRILGRNVSIDVAAEAPQTVEFSYPRSFSARSVLQIIRLEFGALAAPSSRVTRPHPYVARQATTKVELYIMIMAVVFIPYSISTRGNRRPNFI